jgi:hypothetical protein
MKHLSFHPQFSPQSNKSEKFDCSHYIETVDIAKIIKMGSLHASQKWYFSEIFFFFWIELSKFMIKATT